MKKKTRIKFIATRVGNKPVKVTFYTENGEIVSFKGIKTFTEKLKKSVRPLKVNF